MRREEEKSLRLATLFFVPIILAKIGNNYYLLQNRMIENDLAVLQDGAKEERRGAPSVHSVAAQCSQYGVTARERIVVIPCFQILH